MNYCLWFSNQKKRFFVTYCYIDMINVQTLPKTCSSWLCSVKIAANCAVWSVHLWCVSAVHYPEIYIVCRARYSVQCAVISVRYGVFSVQSVVCIVLWIVCSVLCRLAASCSCRQSTPSVQWLTFLLCKGATPHQHKAATWLYTVWLQWYHAVYIFPAKLIQLGIRHP